MTISEAAKILETMYKNADSGDKVTQIHLFGIKYANELQNMSLHQVAVLAGISPKYNTEISKGRRLSKYVEIRAITD